MQKCHTEDVSPTGQGPTALGRVGPQEPRAESSPQPRGQVGPACEEGTELRGSRVDSLTPRGRERSPHPAAVPLTMQAPGLTRPAPRTVRGWLLLLRASVEFCAAAGAAETNARTGVGVACRGRQRGSGFGSMTGGGRGVGCTAVNRCDAPGLQMTVGKGWERPPVTCHGSRGGRPLWQAQGRGCTPGGPPGPLLS